MFDNGSFLRRRKRYKRPMKGVMNPYPAKHQSEVNSYMHNIGFPLHPPLPPFLMPHGPNGSAVLPLALQQHAANSYFNVSPQTSQVSTTAHGKSEAMKSLMKESAVTEPTKFSIDNIIGNGASGHNTINNKLPPHNSLTDNQMLAAAVGLPILPVHWNTLERLRNQLRLPVNTLGLQPMWPH